MIGKADFTNFHFNRSTRSASIDLMHLSCDQHKTSIEVITNCPIAREDNLLLSFYDILVATPLTFSHSTIEFLERKNGEVRFL